MIKAKPIEILLVEDSPSDAALLIEAFGEQKVENKMWIVRDGEEAISFLKKEREWRDVLASDLVFLDLNLPCKDGREVLKEIKSDPKLCTILVVVMTTSAAEQDILMCYQLQASSYIIKPLNIDQFLKFVKTLCDYRFYVVTLPPVQ